MTITKPNKISQIRYLASSFFIIVALVNLVDSFTNNRPSIAFDMTFFVIALLPLLINKRLFLLGYGLIGAFFSLVILLIYAIQADTTYLMQYLLGLLVFILGLAGSLALIYVGVYSNEKGRFRLV